MNKEIFNRKYFIFFLTFIFPISLITGPAIPDILASLFGICAIYILIKSREIEFIKSKLIIYLIFFWVLLLISSLLSEYILFSMKSSAPYIRLIFFSMFVFFMCKNSYFISSLFWGFTIAYIIIILDSSFLLIQTNFAINDMGKPKLLSNFFDGERIVGSFISRTLPIYIGLFLLLKNNTKLNFLVLLIIAFSLFVVTLSGERAAIFYSILFLSLIFVLFKKFRYLIISILILLSIILSITGTYKNFKNRFIDYTVYQIFNNKDKLNIFSVQHEELFKTSNQIFKENIIFGSGPNTFRIECKKYNSENLDFFPGCSTSPHNIYIQLLSETGIVGLAFLILLYFVLSFIILREIIFRNFFNKSILDDSFLFFNICIFINLWPLIPTGNFFHNWLNIIYYMPLGLIIYSYKFNKESKQLSK